MEDTYLLAMRGPAYRRHDSYPGFRTELENRVGDAKERKPMRCQATTVCGLTMASVERQSRQIRDRETQRRRSMEVNLGRFFSER